MLKSAVSLAVCTVLASGCGSRPPQDGSRAEAQLQLLGTLYGNYISQNNGKAPVNEEQFKEFLKAEQVQTKNQEERGVESLLTSPRDGLPLVIRYGKLSGPMSPNGYPWIAHEQTGIEGKRWLISARGEVNEVSEQELEGLFSSDTN